MWRERIKAYSLCIVINDVFGDGKVSDMEKFCVINNSTKDKEYKIALFIKEYLEEKGKECKITTDYKIESGCKKNTKRTEEKEIDINTEAAIVLGGDGTIIQAAHDLISRDIPILGVNLGTLGFLAEIEKQNIQKALDALISDMYDVESRMMLEGKAVCQGEEIVCGAALNDFVISKGGFCHLITIKVFINEELAATYRADGVIISTPTGSTGYNLSAGGPVMVPELQAVSITPICPHSLNNRSLVVRAEDIIRLEIGSSKEMQIDESVIVVDGQILNHMITGDVITIKKSKKDTKIIKLTESNFFHIFRKKIG